MITFFQNKLYGQAIFVAVVGLAIFSIKGCTPSDTGHMMVNAKTTIYVNEREPLAIHKAVIDLAEDMKTVFGREIKIINDLNEAGPSCLVVTHNAQIKEDIQKPVGDERLQIQAIKDFTLKEQSVQAIILTGSDMRGTIYAIYEFSERFLGIDPLYWWTDQEIKHKESVAVPDDYLQVNASPTIKYRGLFINDEDLLSGWMSGTWRYDAIRPEGWDHIFEAILRMKGNMVTPGTFNFPYEPK